MRKELIIGSTIIGISLALLAGYMYFVYKVTHQAKESPQVATAIQKPEIQPEPTGKVRLMFVGDIMVDRGVENSVKRNFEGDFNHLFDHLQIFQEADSVFGNLEGPATDKGTIHGSKFSFQMNPAILPILRNHKFDVVSFSNNHIGDYGMEGFADTLKRGEAAGIQLAGAGVNADDASAVKIIEKNGVKIGFIAFTDVGPDWMKATDTAPGILLASNPHFDSIIREAKKSVDVLVVSFHWGIEYQKHTTRQTELAHKAINAGGDLIIGAHPHVIQDTEWYKGKFIAYSLGNFIFDQYFSPETLRGMLLDITVSKTDIISVSKKIIEMSEKYQAINVRDATPEDSITKKLQVETCPQPKNKTQPDLWLLPVSPNQSVAADYIPKNLIPMKNRIDARGSATCLTESAGLALEHMIHTGEKSGVKFIMTSGFREFDIQKRLHDTDNVPEQDADGEELSSVAEPGHSEHQLGIAVDLKSGTSAELTYKAFKQSAEYKWLNEHAHEYGFVQSFLPGKEKVTGYIEEPWHWRYVGPTYAKAIRTLNIVPVEFLREPKKYLSLIEKM